jgi:hypothetical protein
VQGRLKFGLLKFPEVLQVHLLENGADSYTLIL